MTTEYDDSSVKKQYADHEAGMDSIPDDPSDLDAMLADMQR